VEEEEQGRGGGEGQLVTKGGGGEESRGGRVGRGRREKGGNAEWKKVVCQPLILYAAMQWSARTLLQFLATVVCVE